MKRFPIFLAVMFLLTGIAFQTGAVDTAAGYYRHAQAGYPSVFDNCPYANAHYHVRNGEIIEARCFGGSFP
jgi:hypothetical protein